MGLYPNQLNKVEVTLDFDGGQQVDVIEIQTEQLPDYFPTVNVDKLEKDSNGTRDACYEIFILPILESFDQLQ